MEASESLETSATVETTGTGLNGVLELPTEASTSGELGQHRDERPAVELSERTAHPTEPEKWFTVSRAITVGEPGGLRKGVAKSLQDMRGKAHGDCQANRATPAPIMSPPSARAIMSPFGASFSIATRSVSAAIQSRFIAAANKEQRHQRPAQTIEAMANSHPGGAPEPLAPVG